MSSPLGLTDAVNAGIRASRLRTADDQAAEDRAFTIKQRAVEERALDATTAADAAANGVIKQAMDAHAASGSKSPYRVGPLDAVRALNARGAAFVKAGDFESFMKNEGTAAAARLKARAQFIQDFQQTGDFDSFVRNAYSTLPDGDDVDKVEMVKGGAADAPKGAPSGPDMARVTFKSGKTAMVDPRQVVARVQSSLRDPAAAAEQEAKLHYESLLAKAKEDAKTPGEIAKAKATGEQARQTETLKHQNALGLAAVNNTAAAQRAQTAAGATITAAKVRAGADGAGAGGGAGARIQSTRVDDRGYMVGVFRDGSARRLVIDGKPVRSQDFTKQVNAMTKVLGESLGNIGKPPEELRKQAEEMLFGAGSGGAGGGNAEDEDFSNLWTE